MARKSTLKTVDPIVEDLGAMTPAAVLEEGQAQQLRVMHEQNMQKIDQQYELVPYDRTRVSDEIRFYLNVTGQAAFEVGRRLVQMKSNEESGQWLKLLEAVGISPRTAQQYMQVARVLSEGTYSKIEKLGYSKVVELISESSETLSEIENDTDLFDAIDRMSAMELRRRLREERIKKDEEREVLEIMLDDKSKKIDQLDMALAKKDKVTKRDTEAALQAQIKAQSAAIEYAATQTLNGLLDLQKLAREIEQNAELPEELLFAATQALDRIQHRINDMRSGMAVLPDMSPIEDDWIAQAEQAGIA